MDLEERKKLIAQYRDGYAAVADVLLKITPEELDAKPGPGPLVGARDPAPSRRQRDDRRRPAAAAPRAGSADDPGLRSGQFARALHYDRPHETSLELFRWARESTAELLERLTPAEWLREGTHTEAGALRRRGVAEDLCRPRAQARPSDQRGAGGGEEVGISCQLISRQLSVLDEPSHS